MTAIILRRATLACAALVLAATTWGAEPPIIAKARAFVGTESALAALKSVHYTGSVVTGDPADPAKQERAAMEIIFQKPEQQRISATSDKRIEVTALDGYEGWSRIQDAKDPSKWRTTLLGPEHIKRLRANVWQNLWYYRDIEKFGGRIEDEGTKTIDGITCQKIAFIHAPNIIFFRYFDVATGRLVFTETETGSTIREQGELIVQGIRFPRALITTTKNAKGETQTVTINFDKIDVNTNVPASLFAVPTMRR